MKKPTKWKAAVLRFQASGNSYYLSGNVMDFHYMIHRCDDLIDKSNKI